jgi:biotin operon repressor
MKMQVVAARIDHLAERGIPVFIDLGGYELKNHARKQ